MKKTIIGVIVAIAIIAIAYYFLIYKPKTALEGTRCAIPIGDRFTAGIYKNGKCTIIPLVIGINPINLNP